MENNNKDRESVLFNNKTSPQFSRTINSLVYSESSEDINLWDMISDTYHQITPEVIEVVDQEIVICPNCDSINYDYQTTTEEFISVYFCNNCLILFDVPI